MFQNRSDSALQDLMIHDIVPSDFEIKGYNIRSDSGVREAEMEKADDENGIKVSWHIPVIEKDERIEVIYELVGDAGAEYKVSDAQEFHGATFGDELDVDLPASEPETEPEEEKEEEEVVEETTEEEESVEEDSEEDESDEEESEDDGDAEDDAESEDDAEPEDDSNDDDSEDEGESEEPEETAESDSGDAGAQVCPICSSENAPGANVCSTCSFDFE
nr:hypothetical protein [Euryarchaeota archaeon]